MYVYMYVYICMSVPVCIYVAICINASGHLYSALQELLESAKYQGACKPSEE